MRLGVLYMYRNKEKRITMYTVKYRFYNYAVLEKTFETRAKAKGFFFAMSRRTGVKYAELVGA